MEIRYKSKEHNNEEVVITARDDDNGSLSDKFLFMP
jgi:hypothetical protein